MSRKVAIFDNEEVVKFLKQAKTLEDEVRTYMLVAYGMHPENLRRLTIDMKNSDRITKDGLLEFKRAKNDKGRRELLSPEVAEVIYNVVKKGKLKISNTYYERICAEQGNILTQYYTPPVSPLTLRHTYALNCLRNAMNIGGIIDFNMVATKMGCSIDMVRGHYLDLIDWERVTNKQYREPLDLTHWKFQKIF